jgi:hypothetical protein
VSHYTTVDPILFFYLFSCSGFHGIYDVEHFIRTLRFDVKIVESIPENEKNGKKKKIKAFQVYYYNLAIDE